MAAAKKKASGKSGGDGGYATSRTARTITQSLLQNLNAVASGCDASAIFVYLDALGERTLQLSDELASRVIYISSDPETTQEDLPLSEARLLRVPAVPLTRMGQIKIAVFLALSRGFIKPGDVVLFLSGVARTGTIDTILISEVGREFEAFSAGGEDAEVPTNVSAEVLERVVDLAVELGNEGREGKPVGAIFVLGDTEKVLSLSRQMILNPFRGYDRKDRNILDEAVEETVKEFSTLDGAFVLRGDGVIETCGAYLKTASQEEFELPQGLGTRHHAAAAITAVTEAIAVTVSESTGTVTIFRRGRPITEIERPRHAPSRRRPLRRSE